MYRKQLEKTFCRKIERELKQFKSRMLKLEKEEIFQAAYRIDSMICIYEALMEMSGRIAEETLEAVTAFPSLLAFLYGRWMKYEDSYMEDVEYCLNKELSRLRGRYKKRRKERTA
ncbi:hypothetical protein C818_02267 [Lachnospiraceae bacterium MD308]|nr:hypothetical protein C818_02267 [Lachnospiraceae bacterium MD308]